MHLVRAAIYGVRGRAVKPANASGDGLCGAIESRFEFAQRWIASSQVLLAITDDAALPTREIHPALGLGRCSIAIPIAASLRTLPRSVFSAEYFPLLRGNRRFRGDGSATGSVSCHSSLRQRCRGFAACLPQDGKIPRIAVKCLNAGPNRSAMRN